MGKSNFSDEFKRDAVRQITERGYPVLEVSQRLRVPAHSLYERRKTYRGRSIRAMNSPTRSGGSSANW
jgi:transposase